MPSLPSLTCALQRAPPSSRPQLRPPSPARQAGANKGAQLAGSVPGSAADDTSQQGAGDFAEAAVEAIAQRLDMGGCASPTAADVSHKVVQRFLDGVDIAGIIHKCTSDTDVTTAAVIALWQMAVLQHSSSMTAPPPPATTLAAAVTAPTASAQQKAPTILPCGVWQPP